jgi:glycosyltransferase involved in cell wall biosynthesis
MRIAVLSDPNNFHTQKWALALQAAGAEVVVMSYDRYWGAELNAVQLSPPVGRSGKYSYIDYVRGGKVLREALAAHRIDVLNPLNVTPFGVWAMQSGFHPTVACAFGADILEYPPRLELSPATAGRLWESTELQPSRWQRWQLALKRRYFRKKVAAALDFADLVTGDNQFLVDCMRDWFGLSPAKLTVLRWGVEPPLFEVPEADLEALRLQFGILPGQKVVLSPRGAKPIYQTDIILDGIAQVLAGGRSDTVFIQLGAGYAVAPAIAAQAEALAARHPQFKFVAEALPRQQLHALWRLVDAFVSAPVYDGYSAALAEGRYVGAIPIVNDIPAHRELIVHGKNGWVCAPFTAGQLASDLNHLLDHCDKYKALFAPPNRAWIDQHSRLAANADRFILMLQHRLGT